MTAPADGWGDAEPFQRIKSHASWLLIAVFLALACFAGMNSFEKLQEYGNVRAVRDWAETGAVVTVLIHELQTERGLTSGMIASGGTELGPSLVRQHRRTDHAIDRLHRACCAAPSRPGDAGGELRRTVDELAGIAALRAQATGRRIVRDTAFARYTDLIVRLLDHLTAVPPTADVASQIVLQQMAFISLQRAKEAAGQERGLIVAMLMAGDYGTERFATIHRINARESAFQDQFLQLVHPDLAGAYREILRAPFIVQTENMRRLVFAANFGTDPPGAMVAQALRWFELVSERIDALDAFSEMLSARLLDSAGDLANRAGWAVAVNAAGTMVALLLAMSLVVRLLQGKEFAERRLRLAAEVFRNSVDSTIITDAGARIVEVNDAFCRTTGYRADDVIGRQVRILQSGRHDHGFYEAMWDRLASTGSWEGEILNKRKNGEIYPALLAIAAITNKRGETTHYIGTSVDLTRPKEVESLLEKSRTFDALTGLPNRSAWHSALNQFLAGAQRTGGGFAVLDIGVDRFKRINESLGHAVGDEVLIGVAAIVRRVLRRSDVAARIGGDRFAILLPGMRGVCDVRAYCERVLAAFADPVEIQGRSLHVSVSIGVVLYPDDGNDAISLSKNAEIALYSAKTQGGSGFALYSLKLNATRTHQLLVDQRLREALDRGEFLLAYQPQFAARTGRLVGVEALLRWVSPEFGSLPPDQFIPIAEETGIIVPVGQWVLGEACMQAQRWRERHGVDLQMAVNLSARQFRREDLPLTVGHALEASGLPARLLELEITESLLMDDPAGAAQIMQRLRAMGVKIALDDFGTGYSSLGYLKRFPLDRLKLDRSFVRELPEDENDQSISRAVITLGHNLGLEVLAEGVESAPQRDFLASAGCDFFQGYLFGRPMPVDEFERWLDDGGRFAMSRIRIDAGGDPADPSVSSPPHEAST